MTLEDMEPITGSIGDTEFIVSVEQLKIDEQEVKGIQIKLEELSLAWFIHSHAGWQNSFIHTPENDDDKLPPNLASNSSSAPFWMKFDKKLNGQIVKTLKGCGMTKKEAQETINAVSGIINANSLMDKISIASTDDRHAQGDMTYDPDVEIDYDDPLWFMVDKKFSAKAVAERTIQLFTDQHHFVRTIKETKVIHIFNEGVYVDGEDEVEGVIRDFLIHRATIHYVKEVKDEIKRRTLTLLESFNPGDCINMQNGVYKIPFKTFYEADEGIYDEPEMLFLYKLPVEYYPDATCPAIEEFFNWAMPNTLQRDQVYEEFAYGFAPGYPIQKMFVWYGSGRNGKGVAATILRHLIGANNISGWSIENLEGNNDYSQANMVTKKWNICGDMPSRRVPFDFIKSATGGDIIPIREIREKAYNHVNSCKILFMVNNFPEISDFSEGAVRRVIVTVWEVQVPEKDIDPHLSEKLTTPQELSGFFNLLMDSYDNLMERGHFIHNPTVEETEATMSELRGEDVKLFIAEKCVNGVGEKYARKTMYEDYKKWHESRKAKPKGKKLFNSFIRKFGYKTIKYGNEIVWTGIGKYSTESTQVEKNIENGLGEIKVSS